MDPAGGLLHSFLGGSIELVVISIALESLEFDLTEVDEKAHPDDRYEALEIFSFFPNYPPIFINLRLQAPYIFDDPTMWIHHREEWLGPWDED